MGSPQRPELTNPDRDLYISAHGTRLPRRIAEQPRGRRGRPGPHHPDPRARVRRLRQRGPQVPRRADARDRVHRLPPQAGRLRPAPGQRPDGARQAAVRGHHARADGHLRRRHRALRAAEQVAHHDAAEHPDPPRAARPDGEAHPRDLRIRALLPRGLRQHRPQRHRRPARRCLRGRGLRPHAVRRRVRALLRPPPHDAADAAQGQDGLRRHAGRACDLRHPRHRVPRPRARRRARLRGAPRRRHVDHAAGRARRSWSSRAPTTGST